MGRELAAQDPERIKHLRWEEGNKIVPKGGWIWSWNRIHSPEIGYATSESFNDQPY